jgi:hypothetical protein
MPFECCGHNALILRIIIRGKGYDGVRQNDLIIEDEQRTFNYSILIWFRGGNTIKGEFTRGFAHG